MTPDRVSAEPRGNSVLDRSRRGIAQTGGRTRFQARYRLAGGLALLLVIVGLLIWRTPDLGPVSTAFSVVSWPWILASVVANVLSVLARAASWGVVLDEALPPPPVRRRHVASAFSIGVIANAFLPGRVGELARVGVLTTHIPNRRDGAWATVLGSVFGHRILDVIPSAMLIALVLLTADLPEWAGLPVGIIIGVGAVLLVGGFVLAWRQRSEAPSDGNRLRILFSLAAQGLSVFRAPKSFAAAGLLQTLGWAMELFGIWLAFKAFGIDAPLSAACVVLVVTNLAALFPLWPGNVGLFQAAVALPLLAYNVSYLHGLLFGVGLQAIEIVTAIAVGFPALVREGVSLGGLRRLSRPGDGLPAKFRAGS